jgi:hypothetical protein
MPSTTRSHDPKPPKTHILDFFYDEDDDCAFTARINDVRFHIIVSQAKLKASGGRESAVLREYRQRLQCVKRKDEADQVEEANVEMGLKSASNKSEDRDSGVDMAADQEEHEDAKSDSDKEQQAKHQDQHDHDLGSSLDPALDLQNWILLSFGEQVPQKPVSEDEDRPARSIQEWYDTPIKYYEMQLSEDEEKLVPTEIEQDDRLRKRVDDLQPHVPLPKTLRSLPIPWVQASSVTVEAETDDPPPVHPSLVRASVDGNNDGNDAEASLYFFKPVDSTQPPPTKREIELLHKIHTLGLDKDFRVPQIHALVGYQSSKVECMGMLLTTIPDPVPLTKLLDSEVDESKRKRWAKETERIVSILHENDIVWGDAKADNFLVDKEDHVWVIDFGGSYTDGWVDPELKETLEGDDMGLERIVNGLLDPDGMTCEEPEEANQAGVSGKKRSREEENDDAESDDEVDGSGSRKKSRH